MLSQKDILVFFTARRRKQSRLRALKVLGDVFDFVEQTRLPVSVRFVVPRHRNPKTGAWNQMPTSLLDDQISNIPLEFDNLGGEKVDPPADGVATVVLDNVAMGTVALGADGKSVDFTPAVPPPAEGTVGVITYTDTSGAVVLPATLDVSITKDLTAANVHFQTDQITTRPMTPAP